MTEETKNMLAELGKSDFGDALREYLNEELEKLKGDIDSVEDWPDILGRRKARKIIKEVLYFLEPRQPKEPNKNQYV